MRRLKPGEEDVHPAYHPGYFKEWCFMPMKIVKPDPLFDGLRDTAVVREFHAFEVKELPHFDDKHPDGEKIVANFFTIAGLRPNAQK